MSADNNGCGIYNDLDNEWMIFCAKNSHTKLYFDGGEKLATTNTGVSITGDIVISSNLTVGTANIHVDTLTGRVGVGTNTPGYTLDVNGTVNTGALTATSVSGNGSGLTSLDADNLSSGTVSSDRLSLVASDIPSLDASKITSGTLGRPISTTTGVFTSNGNAVLVGPSGGGQVGLTINDGDGNTNITFNHASLIPDQNGSSGRIDCGVDGTSGYMRLRVKDNVTGGTSTGNLPECVRIEEGYVRAYSDFYAGGNVGIGTTSPNYKLDVNGDINFTGTLYENGAAFSGGGGGGGSSVWGTSGTSIYYNSGNVGVGVVSPTYKLHVVGDIYASGDVIMFSDERKKTNIEVISNALEKVLQMRGVTFKKLDDGNRRHSGIIAQDVEKVLPEVVYTAEDGTKSVAYGNMIGIIIEAIKELSRK